MKKLLGIAVALLSTMAMAQDTGTIRLHGTIGSIVILSAADDTGLAADYDWGAAINAKLAANDLTPIEEIVGFRMRSNTAYTLAAQMSPTTTGTSVTPDLISYEFSALASSGAKVHNATTHETDDLQAPNATGTIDTLTASKVVYDGEKISTRGHFSDSDNYVGGTVTLGLVPELFEANDAFDYTITLTMAAL